MTAGGDFIPKDLELDEGPVYPTIFGITLTPVISGLLIALLGVAAAVYGLANFVSPEWTRNQDLEAKVREKSNQLQQQDQIVKQIAEAKTNLEQARQQRDQVLALFSNERTLDTLLLDMNQLIERNNAGRVAATRAKLNSCPVWVRDQYSTIVSSQEFEDKVGPLVAEARLTKFEPDPKLSGIVSDGALGPAVNNKLKRQVVNVQFEGNFNQTQSIFRTIERLQSLLLLRNLQVTVGRGGQAAPSSQIGGLYEIVPGPNIRFLTNCQPDTVLTTSFQMEALLPLSPAEQAAVAPKPTPGASPAATPAAPR